MKDEAARMPKHGIHFFRIVCLFVHFFFGGGGRGESELPFILSKTGFGYGASAKRLPKVYLILRVQCNRQIEEGWLI